MKLTLSWLKEYLQMSSEATTDSIIATLTSLGLEVENVENKAALYEPFKVVTVRSAEKHPDANRLRVCQVEVDNSLVQVVCGAPNARSGMKAMFAPTGSYIPGLDTILQKAVIRGQESNGMLVSEYEMCLSDNHDGIIDLPEDTAVGTSMLEIFPELDEVIIDISLTPNRADCAGIVGIARDLAAAGQGDFVLPKHPEIDEKFESSVNIFTDTPETCPYFIGRTIKGVKNGSSPKWLQKRLQAIGLRPISALVDITNYFCIGLNRPLHVYDADKLSGDIRVKLSRGGEIYDALDGKTYTLGKDMTVITDDSGVLGLGGIVGGISTGVDENTTSVFLECAYFDPAAIARSGRHLQILSDARYRFERGVDPDFLPYATDLATQMILDLCGGEASAIVKTGQPIKWQRSYQFDPHMTLKRGGVSIAEKEQLNILAALGFKIDGKNNPYSVWVPSWRGDVQGAEDLIEEILRVYGYDNIPAVAVKRESTLTQNALSATHSLRMLSVRCLAARGLQECVTWSFMSSRLAHEFDQNLDNAQIRSLTLTNPISNDLDRMRPSILPNLIQAAARNADRGHGNAALFETGPIFKGVNPADQSLVAAGIRHGFMNDKHWSSKEVSRKVDVFDSKADALAVIAAINPSLKTLPISHDAPSYYHPGRSGVLRLGKNILATFGEIHPAILDDIDITGGVVGFEVFLENIPQPKTISSIKPALEISPFQPVKRDFAFIISQDIAADALIAAACKGGGALVTDVTVFDVYQGNAVPEGNKSLAITMTFQPKDKTLTDKDIDEISQGVIKEVTTKTGATLRS